YSLGGGFGPYSKSKVVFAFIITMALLQLARGAAVGYYTSRPLKAGFSYFGIAANSPFRQTLLSPSLSASQSETGVITAAAAIDDLILFLSMHNHALHQISGYRSKLKNNFGSSIEDTEIRLESTGQGRMRELESDGTGATVFHATTVKSNFSDV
ncbi:hypothetical protein MPER_06042, partial [Moniliophthora perniciosa FA553]